MYARGGMKKKKIVAHPTICLKLLPALIVFASAHDDVETIAKRIQALAVTLRAVADHSERVVLEIFLKLFTRPIAPLVYDLFCARKIKGFDVSRVLLARMR